MSSDQKTEERREQTYGNPEEVPGDLAPLERAIVAARQIRLWATWLLETGPAPPKSDELTEAVVKESDR
jgi:hypothetical protein